MSHIERELMKQADDAIINASPEYLKLIQKFDIANQLSGETFYDVYSSILKSKKDQNKIIQKTK